MPITKKSGQVASPLKQDLLGRIKSGKVVPVLSNEVSYELVMGRYADLVKSYADYIDYPLTPTDDLMQMAKFKRINSEIDDWALKSDYLNYIKNRVYEVARMNGVSEELLAQAEEEVDRVNLTEFSAHLGYPRFNQTANDPLLILADLPLPIYLTTSYHGFLEAALQRAGKTPRPEICRWHQGLDGITSVFETDSLTQPGRKYQPTVQEPLVYHLHGLDERPDSLVITDDDYFQFLVAMSRDKGNQANDPVPVRVRQAIADSALILLGFGLSGWAFRAIFWGLIKDVSTHTGIFSIQLQPSPVEKKYYEDYLRREARFDVFWGDIYAYTQELYQKWNG